MKNPCPFKLNSTSASFNQRQKDVFDQLNIIETHRNVSSEESMEVTVTESKRTQRAAMRPFRGKESIFKKPQNPVPKSFKNRIPDYKINPHKWTKYSLEDTEDITDESNTRSALSFLKELAERKKLENKSDDNGKDKDETAPKRILFKRSVKPKPSVGSKLSTVDEDKPVMKNFKVVMPEYVIGQKVIKEKKKTKAVAKSEELKLDHLYDDE